MDDANVPVSCQGPKFLPACLITRARSRYSRFHTSDSSTRRTPHMWRRASCSCHARTRIMQPERTSTALGELSWYDRVVQLGNRIAFLITADLTSTRGTHGSCLLARFSSFKHMKLIIISYRPMPHISAIFGTDNDSEIMNSLYLIANVSRASAALQ